ncbi:MAG TPA: site-2 protease family protein, partial [Candidatus Hydrogenedentes bacterium]|nr:site-2 protease family protein [Candidatus Hydrogenedentota bacterium]
LIALAGPAANFTMMVVFAVIMRVVVIGMDIPPTHEALQNPVFLLVFSMAMINMALMAFNLIPVPPLDGGGIIAPFLSSNGQRILESIGPFGIIIAIIAANHLLPGPMHAMSNAILMFAFWGQV